VNLSVAPGGADRSAVPLEAQEDTKRAARGRDRRDRENAEYAIDMRKVGSVLIKLALQLMNDAREFGTFRDQVGDDIIFNPDRTAAIG